MISGTSKISLNLGPINGLFWARGPRIYGFYYAQILQNILETIWEHPGKYYFAYMRINIFKKKKEFLKGIPTMFFCRTPPPFSPAAARCSSMNVNSSLHPRCTSAAAQEIQTDVASSVTSAAVKTHCEIITPVWRPKRKLSSRPVRVGSCIIVRKMRM